MIDHPLILEDDSIHMSSEKNSGKWRNEHVLLPKEVFTCTFQV
jgi:hypothetical protein